MKILVGAVILCFAMGNPVRAADLAMGMLAYDQGDYPTALGEWLPLAESGDTTAQALLAMMYRTGEGVARDLERAAAWYTRAARQAHPYAQFNLAEMYRDGEGVQRDLVQAHVWFALAAEQIRLSADGTSSATRARDAVAARLTADQHQAAIQAADAFEPVTE